MNPLLEIKALKVAFRGTEKKAAAVEEINLKIEPGEIVVVAGESGSGKTVTALSITGILPQSAEIRAGSIIFEGKELLGCNENALGQIRGSSIAYIFQEPANFFNPILTIGEQVRETIMLHQHKDRAAAEEEALGLLRMVRLDDPVKTMLDFPHQLSGGMNQRCYLAMALACRPKLLIADEPTSSLDVTSESQILELLVSLKKTLGFSLLFITHNLSIAKRFADRIYIFYRGRKVEEGGAEKIFSSPEHPHTKELLAAYEKIGKL